MPPEIPSFGEIIKIEANPKKGFNYNYFLFFPLTMDSTKAQTLLITPTNTGRDSKDYNQIEAWVKFDIETNSTVFEIPLELGVPMLMPVFPRDGTYLELHYLDRDSLLVEGPEKRVDLRLIAMFKDAREQLKKRNIKTKKKFLMTGFSAAAYFVHRFIMLHPEHAVAASAGGLGGLITLPLEESALIM